MFAIKQEHNNKERRPNTHMASTTSIHNHNNSKRKKKERLRTSQEIFNRIKWDSSKNPNDYVMGYLDRFDGMMEIALNNFVTTENGGDIPFHRVYYFKQLNAQQGGSHIVWDRKKRLDLIFNWKKNRPTANCKAETNSWGDCILLSSKIYK